jgi:hypothetical protein
MEPGKQCRAHGEQAIFGERVTNPKRQSDRDRTEEGREQSKLVQHERLLRLNGIKPVMREDEFIVFGFRGSPGWKAYIERRNAKKSLPDGTEPVVQGWLMCLVPPPVLDRHERAEMFHLILDICDMI